MHATTVLSSIPERSARSGGLLRRIPLAALVAALAACSGSGDGGGSSDAVVAGVGFNDVGTAVERQLCTRDALAPPGTASGSIDAGDCSDAGVAGFFESFRIRSAPDGNALLSVSTSFDARVEVFSVVDANDPASYVLLWSSDDLTGLDTSDVAYPIGAGEYSLRVSGATDTAFGTYSVSVHRAASVASAP